MVIPDWAYLKLENYRCFCKIKGFFFLSGLPFSGLPNYAKKPSLIADPFVKTKGRVWIRLSGFPCAGGLLMPHGAWFDQAA
jgi:hypothetical protein